MTSAVNVAGGVEAQLGVESERLSPYEKARRWFISSYPLLGALATTNTGKALPLAKEVEM